MKLRKCEVLSIIQDGSDHSTVKGEWVETPFAELKKGQIYRLFDTDYGGPGFENGTDPCVCLEDAKHAEPEGNHSVQSISVEW